MSDRHEQRDRLWSQLMQQAQAGERSAYEQLLRDVTPLVRALLHRHCRNRADVEEMIQDTLLTVHRVRHTYDPQRPFTPWLVAIASRRAIDSLRRRSRIARHEQTDGEGGYETFSDPAANTDIELVRSSEELSELLQRLPPRQREALELLRLRELSLAEAAASSGQSIGALKVNAHRALKRLRSLFNADTP